MKRPGQYNVNSYRLVCVCWMRLLVTRIHTEEESEGFEPVNKGFGSRAGEW